MTQLFMYLKWYYYPGYVFILAFITLDKVRSRCMLHKKLQIFLVFLLKEMSSHFSILWFFFAKFLPNLISLFLLGKSHSGRQSLYLYILTCWGNVASRKQRRRHIGVISVWAFYSVSRLCYKFTVGGNCPGH